MTIGILLVAVLLFGFPTEGHAFLDSQAIYSQANASVVTIVTRDGHGSGFAVGRKNYVVANYHVIEGKRARSIKVHLTSGQELTVKTIVAVDKKHDLALLMVISAPKSLLPLDLLVDDVPVGSEVAAIGTPMEKGLSNSLTTGVVSGMRHYMEGKEKVMVYQTSAAINQGNSGGPLLNEDGMVIGINSISYRKDIAEGLGFSIHAIYLADLMRSKGIPAPVRSGASRDSQLADANKAKSTIEIKTLPKGSYESISDEIDRELKQAELDKHQAKKIREEKEFENKDHIGERHRGLRNPRMLVDAAKKGDAVVIRDELEKGVDPNSKYNGLAPLAAAAINGQSQVIKLLLSHGASPLVVDSMDQTALIHASKLGKIECVRELLQAQNSVDQRDSNGRTALIYAAVAGSREIVEALVDVGSDYSLRDFDGNTAEELASTHSHSGISTYLFQVKYRAEKER